MNREKFEEWFYSFYEPKEWRYIDMEKSYAAWLAGRESMRDEAFNACENEHLEDPQDNQDDAYDNAVMDCKRAIRKIDL